MRISVARETGGRLAQAVDALLPGEPELPYANFAPIAARAGAARSLHRGRWLASGEESWVVRDSRGDPLAALRWSHRPFESAHFGRSMSMTALPLAASDRERRRAGLFAAYRALVEHQRERGCVHAAFRASTRDRVTPWVLQELGAFHVDTQVSWMAALTGTPHDDALPPPLRLEIRDRAGLAKLAPESWKGLMEWAGHAFDRGPLVFDHTLPRERSLGVYAAWSEKALRGEWADAVLLVRDGDAVVAFISMLHLPDVSEAAGCAVYGRGLGATLPEYRGLFTAIQREMIAAQPLGARFMENETQVATIGSINVYAKLGFRYLRSTSTFHLCLDGASAPCA